MNQQGEDCLIELVGVSKSFKEPSNNPFKKRRVVQALADVSISLPRRKITCLLGPNGAGKTTLIKILASLIAPDSGSMVYDGRPIEGWDKSLQGKIGLVTPNERSFYWRLTGRQNLEFFGSLYRLAGKALESRVGEVIESTGLAKDADKPYRLYSSGAKQKLNLARALMGRAELFLLDEPAAHLDPLAREDFRQFVKTTLIGELGSTVFLCTHDLAEAERLADYIIVLDEGRVVAAGSREQLRTTMLAQAELEIRYSGELPAEWMRAHAPAARMQGPGLLRYDLDSRDTGQEEILRSFVIGGGALVEAYRVEEDLFGLLERRTRTHV